LAFGMMDRRVEGICHFQSFRQQPGLILVSGPGDAHIDFL